MELVFLFSALAISAPSAKTGGTLHFARTLYLIEAVYFRCLGRHVPIIMEILLGGLKITAMNVSILLPVACYTARLHIRWHVGGGTAVHLVKAPFSDQHDRL